MTIKGIPLNPSLIISPIYLTLVPFSIKFAIILFFIKICKM